MAAAIDVDDIETEIGVPPLMLIQPVRCQRPDPGLLAPIDGFGPRAEPAARSCLHLDEGHQRAPSDDQIQFPPAASPVSAQNLVAVLAIPVCGALLAEATESPCVGGRAGAG